MSPLRTDPFTVGPCASTSHGFSVRSGTVTRNACSNAASGVGTRSARAPGTRLVISTASGSSNCQSGSRRSPGSWADTASA